tara:strand:- start:39014 stop:39172 length:159 start_codon:yes stop_codon:yes gene_type:complete
MEYCDKCGFAGCVCVPPNPLIEEIKEYSGSFPKDEPPFRWFLDTVRQALKGE